MTRLVSMLLIGAAVAVAVPAVAGREDHDRARRALEQGEVLPLGRILAIARADTPGRVIEVEFERDDGRWIYELELLTPGGRLIELEMDGATGRVLDRDHDRWDAD